MVFQTQIGYEPFYKQSKNNSLSFDKREKIIHLLGDLRLPVEFFTKRNCMRIEENVAETTSLFCPIMLLSLNVIIVSSRKSKINSYISVMMGGSGTLSEFLDQPCTYVQGSYNHISCVVLDTNFYRHSSLLEDSGSHTYEIRCLEQTDGNYWFPLSTARGM